MGSILDFFASAFRGLVSIILVLIIIGFAIIGAVIGGGGGFFLGLLIGFVVVVLSGGLIANFLNMVDDISTIKYHLSKNENTSGGSSSFSGNSFGTNTNYVSPVPKVNDGDTWICKKCNETNSISVSRCKSCGESCYG